jgi:hypothetical protein
MAVRVSMIGVDDPGAGVVCRLDSGSHFDSASVVKVTILGTLLRDAQAAHRSLTRTERSLAWAMITRSDNGAASALWDEDGRSRLQRFLDASRRRVSPRHRRHPTRWCPRAPASRRGRAGRRGSSGP